MPFQPPMFGQQPPMPGQMDAQMPPMPGQQPPMPPMPQHMGQPRQGPAHGAAYLDALPQTEGGKPKPGPTLSDFRPGQFGPGAMSFGQGLPWTVGMPYTWGGMPPINPMIPYGYGYQMGMIQVANMPFSGAIDPGMVQKYPTAFMSTPYYQQFM